MWKNATENKLYAVQQHMFGPKSVSNYCHDSLNDCALYDQPSVEQPS